MAIVAAMVLVINLLSVTPVNNYGSLLSQTVFAQIGGGSHSNLTSTNTDNPFSSIFGGGNQANSNPFSSIFGGGNQATNQTLNQPDVGRVTRNTSVISTTTGLPAFHTYNNSIWGISVQYPSNWTASTTGLGYRDLIAFYSPLQSISEVAPTELKISGAQYTHNVSFPAFINLNLMRLKQTQQILNQSHQILEVKSSTGVSIAGHPGHRIVLAYKPSQNSTFTINTMNIWTTVGNKAYILMYQGEEQRFTQYLPEVGRILESLRIVP